MRKMKYLLTVVLFAFCGMGASAQDWKSILSDVAKRVVGDKTTTAASIVGTWSYVAPDCEFESDNLLAKAGGDVATTKIKQQLDNVYKKIGLTSVTYTFNSDGTYSSKFGKASTSGTYTFDADKKTVTMKTRLGFSQTAYVTVVDSKMNLLFDADKLMTVLKSVTAFTAKLNTNAALINTLVSNYDGLRLGFELKKN